MNPSRPSLATAFEPPPEVATPSVPEIGGETQELSSSDRAFITARMLWDERRFVGVIVLRGTLLFLIVAFLIPATYESRTQLMPPDQRSSAAAGMLAAMTGGLGGSSGAGGGALGMLGDLFGLKTSGALFMSILRSETVQNRLIDRFDLRKVYWVSTYKSARKELSSRTDIGEDKKSGVISITVTDRNRQRAAVMAQAYVDELNHLVVDLNTSSAHRERVFLEGRLKVVKQDLDTSSKAFSEFASKNTAIDIKEQGKAMLESAAILQGQLIAAQSELRGLEQIYTPNNVRVRSLQARVSELQRQLQKLGGASGDATGSDADQTYPSIRQLPVLGVPYYDLYRTVRINETVFEFLTKEYELARVEEAKEVPSVKLIDVARPPEKRSGPPRKLITLVGALLSLCFAAVWLFAKESWKGMDPQDPRKTLATDVATTVTNSVPWKRAAEISSKVLHNGLRRRFSSNHNHNRNESNERSE